jgi:hypothetical protein
LAAERYALLADESGNMDEPVCVLAGLSGPLRSLLFLERDLRRVLERHGISEVKWSALRTRPRRLLAAAEFLEIAGRALSQGKLAVDLLVWEQVRSKQKHSKEERWLALYLSLVKRVRSRWKGATLKQLALYPDQRTGMPWSRLKRKSGVKTVREASSHELALIQLADLLAGLSRFLRQPAEPSSSGARARRNRWNLAVEFEALCRKHKRNVGLWEVSKVQGGLQ